MTIAGTPYVEVKYTSKNCICEVNLRSEFHATHKLSHFYSTGCGKGSADNIITYNLVLFYYMEHFERAFDMAHLYN